MVESDKPKSEVNVVLIHPGIVVEAPTPHRVETGGGGGHTEGMDPWQQTVETRLGQLHNALRDLGKKVDRNFIITWGGIIGLGIMLIKGFNWL